MGLEVPLRTDLADERVDLVLVHAQFLPDHVAHRLDEVEHVHCGALEHLGVLAAHAHVQAVRRRDRSRGLALDLEVDVGVLLEHVLEVRTARPGDELPEVLARSEDRVRQPALAVAPWSATRRWCSLLRHWRLPRHWHARHARHSRLHRHTRLHGRHSRRWRLRVAWILRLLGVPRVLRLRHSRRGRSWLRHWRKRGCGQRQRPSFRGRPHTLERHPLHVEPPEWRIRARLRGLAADTAHVGQHVLHLLARER
mmetsp:Transcript_58804/g.151213  ORF Transcript_58804/g.151213 Transcript_58804/m.151213 type:complete len:253 (-) Transcript_58804:4476-5234(-)